MRELLQNIGFQIFIVTLTAIVLNIFLKMLSKDDRQKPIELKDLTIGYELAITSLLFFINDYIMEIANFSSNTSQTELSYKFVYAPFIVIIFIILLTILTYFIRKTGWKTDTEMKLSAIILQNIFGIVSLILVFIWIKK